MAKNLATKADAAIKKADQPDYKLRTKLGPEWDEQISAAYTRLNRLNVAYKKQTNAFLKDHTDKDGKPTKSNAEFADGLNNAIYNAFQEVTGWDKKTVSGIADIYSQGAKASDSDLAARQYFEALTGLDTIQLKKEIVNMEKPDLFTLENIVTETVSKSAHQYVTELVGKKYAAMDDGKNAKAIDTFNALANIMGLKIPDSDKAIPPQRHQIFNKVIGSALQKYGQEYL